MAFCGVFHTLSQTLSYLNPHTALWNRHSGYFPSASGGDAVPLAHFTSSWVTQLPSAQSSSVSITVGRSPCCHDIIVHSGVSRRWALASIVWVPWQYSPWQCALRICRALSSRSPANKQLEATFQKSAEHLAEAKQIKKGNDCTVFSWFHFLHCLGLVFSGPWKTPWK